MKAVINLVMTVLLLIPALTYATNSGDYQTSGNVTFSSQTNWQYYNGSTWVNASSAPSSNTSAQITINANHTAAVSANIILNNLTVNQSAALTINSGKTLTISANGFIVASGGTVNNNGTLTLNGTSTFSGTIINSGSVNANATIKMYGTYRHATSSSNFPSGTNITWYAGSTCEITGVTSSLPNFSGNTFYNFTWNCASQNSDIVLNNYLTTVSGDLNILNTNSKYITFFNANGSLNVGGNMNFSGTSNANMSSSSITSSITITGNYAQSGGTFNIGNGTNGLYVKGNFTASGGSVTNVSGTAKISFSGTALQYFASTNPNPFSSKVNIEVARYSSLQLTSDMNFTGSNLSNLFYVYGYLNLANFDINNNFYFNVSNTGTLVTGTGSIASIDTTHNSFEISSGGVVYIGSPDGITTSGTTGNIQVNGTRIYNTGAKYAYNGTSAQVTGNGLPASFSDLVTSNASGVTLSSNATVTDSLFMTTGNISTGNYTLTLSNAKSGSLVYTEGLINGKFARSIANGNASYTFPLGNSSQNRTATITFTTQTSSAGTLTTQYLPGNQGGTLSSLTDAGNYTIDTYSQDGAWQFTYSGPSNPVFNLNLIADGIAGANTPSSLRIISRTNSSSAWSLSGTHSNGSGSPIKANRTGMTFSALSQFAIGGNSVENPLDGTLPVKLTSFISNVSNGRDVRLNWVTAHEMNNSGFDIQRKDNNSDYKKIGFAKGNNNTNSNSTYSFEDKALPTGKYSYRLKQIDNNGNFEYFELSNTIEVGAPAKFSLSQNYPNPFNPVTKINYTIAVAGQVTLKIYDMTGKEVKVLVNEVKAPGFYTVDLNGANLSSGIYVYRIIANNFTDTKKMSMIK
jgi:hypothetical protein